jgi:bifunctional DNA-binding transcriptional regulator/antitoxin component of YhaV-PrlF toxin-antitoxin module
MPTRKKRNPERRTPRARVDESRAAYIASPPEDETAVLSTTRLSSKNQITLPAAMLRRLEWVAGDDIWVNIIGDAVLIEKAIPPDELVDKLRGSMAHVPEWRTKESIDAWVRSLRDEWDRE